MRAPSEHPKGRSMVVTAGPRPVCRRRRSILHMPRENLIGEYLRARRELVRPGEVGLQDLSGRRRVAGLRRAEVALRAGVSTDYYVRLEQGRDQHPSPQVLDALARALQLDEDATAHLHRLANRPTLRRRRTARPERSPEGIVKMIQVVSETPAFVEGRYTDVLAVNSLATALAPYYAAGRTPLPRDIPQPTGASDVRRRLGAAHREGRRLVAVTCRT